MLNWSLGHTKQNTAQSEHSLREILLIMNVTASWLLADFYLEWIWRGSFCIMGFILMASSQTVCLALSLYVIMNSDRTKLLTRYLLVITLQSESWGLLLYSLYNFPLKMVSFYLIFCTAKWDGVFDQLFCDTLLKMSSYIAFLLLQIVLNPFTDKFISFWLFHQCRLLRVTAPLLVSPKTGPVLTSLQELEWGGHTA